MAEKKKWNPKSTNGGVYVIVIVGVLLLFELGLDWGNNGNVVFAALVIVGTAVLALLAKRFIDRHADQIGEARFPRDK